MFRSRLYRGLVVGVAVLEVLLAPWLRWRHVDAVYGMAGPWHYPLLEYWPVSVGLWLVLPVVAWWLAEWVGEGE